MNATQRSLPLIVPALIDGKVEKKIWKTAKEHYFNSPETGFSVTIAKGFKFDGATIPSPFWAMLNLHPFSPRIITAALEHDFCYFKRYNRKQSDKLFYRNLRKYGINKFRAYLMYRAVRLAGWVFYLPNNHWLKRTVVNAL